MAFSPSRKNYTYGGFRREHYTQNRHENVNQANLSQRSPSIRSPKLNEESEYTKLRDIGLIDELRAKLDTVLKHNSHLLNQNATLSEMVNSLKMELEAHAHKEEADTFKATTELKLTINQLQDQQKLQDNELSRLLDEISRLHEDCYRIQCEKNSQIKSLSERHEKEMTTQIRNLKKTSEDGKELYQIQIRKLKQSIQMKSFQFEAIKSQSKIDNDKLRGEVDQLRNQVKHINQLKDIQIRQLVQANKQATQATVKQLERQNSLIVSKLEAKARKFRQDLINKGLELEQANRKEAQSAEEHQQQIDDLSQERQRLLEEMYELEVGGKEHLIRQKEKLIEINELEKKNIEGIAENQRECLKSQINKLSTLCISKSDEIRRLYGNIAQIKETNDVQRRDLDRLIESLRQRIKVLEEDNIEEIELLKIKMAHLHESDIISLEKFYQNEIALLLKKIKQLENEKDSDREKIHKLLQQNDELRKNFEIQLTKYKAKVQDYKVKFASANLEFREQITSLGTRMELTSQTLLREAQQKQKGAEFFEAEKKKFHLLISGKDKQIAATYDSMNRLKQLHAEEVKQLRDDLSHTREALADKINQIKEAKKVLEDQFEMKSQKILLERNQTPNDVLTRENIELRDKVEAAEKQTFKKLKQVQFLQKQVKSLQQEVGLRAGFLQTMQLESSAAIQDERSKMKILMNENEVAMKDYYESKMASKNKDIEALKEQLHEKQNDIRQLIGKYHQLENRLKELLDAQDKLSDFEKKIVNLGLDQNLVKNMGELFARYKK